MPDPLSDDEFCGPSGLPHASAAPIDWHKLVENGPSALVGHRQPTKKVVPGFTATLEGGPSNGCELFFDHQPPKLLMVGAEEPKACAEVKETTKAHIYADTGDGKRYLYAGFRSITDLTDDGEDEDWGEAEEVLV